MSKRDRIQAEIDQAVAVQNLIYREINMAPAGPLDESWLAARLADIRLVESSLDRLTGRLLAPAK